MLTAIPREELTGLAFLCAGNEGFQAVIEQLATRQSKSITYQEKRTIGSLSGTSSLLTYESPILPLCIESASGSRVTDVDGNAYIDCHMAYTASILGHNPPAVCRAVELALHRGIEGGQFFAEQVELADLVRELVPGVERVGFFHTGGEAINAAVRLARAATGRRRIAKFEGCYHGCNEVGLHNSWMILAGEVPRDPLDQIQPRAATGGVASAGPEELLVLPFNTAVALELIRAQHAELACVVVDPVPSFMSNWIDEAHEFVGQLCRVAEEHEIPVVFDEVVCGFRLARGGAREWSGQSPAMSCYGKITSGLGIPLSILAGEDKFLGGARTGGLFRDHMMHKAWLASTLSGSFLPVVASLAQLRYVAEHYDQIADRLDENYRQLRQRLREFAAREGIPVDLQGNSRLQMQLSIGKTEPTETTYRGMMGTASSAQMRSLLALTLYLRLNGVYTRTVPAMNLSAAHSDEDIAELSAAIEKSLLQMLQHGMIGS